MTRPTSRAHLLRLAILLLIGAAIFVQARRVMKPETWNDARSYREAALTELAQRPSVHGGNQSCLSCHQDEDENDPHLYAMEDLLDGVHGELSCESCHGPLGHHVSGKEKIGDAIVDYTRIACLKCHGNLVSLPVDFPKFILADEPLPPNREAELREAATRTGAKDIFRHKKKVHDGMNCLECHTSFHDPEP